MPLDDHSNTQSPEIRRAKEICAHNGVQLTPLREQTLALILGEKKPLGAYTIMDMLAQASGRTHVAPPTVYRTLDFLMAQGLIHKVHSLNAYIGCSSPHHRDGCDTLFICNQCGITEEIPNNAIQQAINLIACQHKFAVESQMLEIVGQCSHCKKESRTP